MNRKLPFYHLYAVVDKRTGGPLLVGISNYTSDANKFSQAFTAGGLQGLDPADHELGALLERAQRGRLAKSTTAVRCVETDALFVNAAAPAVVHGLSAGAVSVAIAKGLTAAGLHWVHVLRADLTPAQLDFLDRAAAAHLAGEDRAFYTDVLGDVLTGPYIAKYRRAGLTDADLHELAGHVADADQARRLANGELPMSTKCTFTCIECGQVFTTRPLSFWWGVRRCRGCVTRGNVHRR